jgi:hypothetical protein
MRITINIPDELAADVAARGLTPEGYVQGLIAERAAKLHSSPDGREQSLEEFEASLDRLTRYSDKIPSLPIEAFSRESIYGGS